MSEGNLDHPRSGWEETPELTEKGSSWLSESGQKMFFTNKAKGC